MVQELTLYHFVSADRDQPSLKISLTSDVVMGVGPCKLKREHGWVTGTEPTKYDITQHSNLLFLSQPLGVGFSYSDRRNTTTGSFPYIPPKDKDDTTRLAAEASWEIVQTLMKVLPQLDGQLKSKTFNIWGVSVSLEPV